MKKAPSSFILQNDFFKTLIENMQIGVIVSDTDGIILYINSTYARFLSTDVQEAVGRRATDLAPSSRLHLVAKTGQAEINYPLEHKGTGLLVHRVPIFENGVVIAVMGLVLFDSATTAVKLAEKASHLEEKLKDYQVKLSSIHRATYTFGDIIGVSESFQRTRSDAIKAAGSNLPVLITGESGTGKELIAHAVHQASNRTAYPFVQVNCAAIPKDLLESELFGYEKGAFTGAGAKGKIGKFELAHMGSIFLDEIGDMPLEMQPKLLRILETKEIERVGGTKSIYSDFRVIAATNQNIEKLIKSGMFRSDLYYRLNAMQVQVKPLRERAEDIIPLAYHFLQNAEKGPTGKGVRFQKKAEQAIKTYDWPGNARELRYFAESLLYRTEKSLIEHRSLPHHIRSASGVAPRPAGAPLREYLLEAERMAIREALEEAGGNKTQAAEILGIHRTILYRKMNKLGL